MYKRLGFLVCALGMFLLPAQVTAQEGDGVWPDSVKIDPTKKELLPGETLTIRLTNFKDVAGNQPKPEFMILVQAKDGKILNGGNPGTSHSLTGKEFAVGLGTVDIVYKAPTAANIEKDIINISSIITVPPEEMGKDPDYQDMPNTEKIGEVEITIRHFDVARITYHDYSHYDDGYQRGTTDVEVKVVVMYRHISFRYYQVESVKIAYFKGIETYKMKDEPEKKCTLASAKLRLHNPLLIFNYDNSGEVTAVFLPMVMLDLEWTGDPGIGPPDDIVIEPVNSYDGDVYSAAVKEAAEKSVIKTEGKKKIPDMKNIAELMRASERLTNHPDFRVTFRFTKYYFGGEANWERADENAIHKKSFTWEVNSRPKGK